MIPAFRLALRLAHQPPGWRRLEVPLIRLSTRIASRLPLLALLPAAVILSGCFAIENGYVVEADGSGSQSIRFAIPGEVLTGAGEELPDVEEMESDPEIAALREALGDRGSMTFFSSEEEGVGFELTIFVEPSDDFAASLAARIAAIAAEMPQEADTSMFDIAGQELVLQRDGDGWLFELPGVSLDAETLGAMTGDPQAAEMAGFFLDQTTVQTRVQLPGEVSEHNADEVLDDGTLVWTQTGVATERTLTARSTAGGSGLSTMAQAALLIGGITLVLAFAGFLIFGRRDRGV